MASPPASIIAAEERHATIKWVQDLAELTQQVAALHLSIPGDTSPRQSAEPAEQRSGSPDDTVFSADGEVTAPFFSPSPDRFDPGCRSSAGSAECDGGTGVVTLEISPPQCPAVVTTMTRSLLNSAPC